MELVQMQLASREMLQVAGMPAEGKVQVQERPKRFKAVEVCIHALMMCAEQQH